MIAQKPDGCRSGWRPGGTVHRLAAQRAPDLFQTPYRIVVNLATKHVQMLVSGRVVMNAPAGTGTGTDPTPPGQFFVAFYEQSLGPGYGRFTLVTSVHSNAIADWEAPVTP